MAHAEQRNGYTVEAVQVNKHRAYLLRPNTTFAQGENRPAKHPAVLLLHDHGAYFTIGKEKMVTPLYNPALDSLTNAAIAADSRFWMEKFYDGQAVADSLAAAGYVVLVTDAEYWGERCVAPASRDLLLGDVHAYNKTLKEYQPVFYETHLKTTGKYWFETILQDDKASITYLTRLPYVDASRIYAFGFSMGAYRAWQLAAEDKRVKACAAAHWMTTEEAQGGFLTNNSSYCMFRPDYYIPKQKKDGTVLPSLDYPDIAATIAPRPFLIQYGTSDRVIKPEGAVDAISIIAHAYEATPSAFRVISYDVSHAFTRQHLTDLLSWLKGLSD